MKKLLTNYQECGILSVESYRGTTSTKGLKFVWERGFLFTDYGKTIVEKLSKVVTYTE